MDTKTPGSGEGSAFIAPLSPREKIEIIKKQGTRAATYLTRAQLKALASGPLAHIPLGSIISTMTEVVKKLKAK